jgi:hypothetical protein
MLTVNVYLRSGQPLSSGHSASAQPVMFGNSILLLPDATMRRDGSSHCESAHALASRTGLRRDSYPGGAAAAFITLWDRTRESVRVAGVAAMTSLPTYLNTGFTLDETVAMLAAPRFASRRRRRT